jgi:O-methyltransferase
MEDAKALYLDLMKRCLTNWIYGDKELADVPSKGFLLRTVASLVGARGIRLVQAKPCNPVDRAKGLDWPPTAHSMIGLERLDNLQRCVENVLKDDVPGDLIETGVWRGGATIFMRAVLKAYGVTDRRVWVADSFEGLPPPDREKYPQDAQDKHYAVKELCVSLEEVKRNFDRYGLLDDQVGFLKGWFKDTLPAAAIERLAVVRLDGDMYESTMDGLVHLYPKLSAGGYLIVDDYGAVAGCRQAVQDFRASLGITEEIQGIDGIGVFWRRTR